MAAPINTGRFNVAGAASISWGSQSPASDSVPVAWNVGDFRNYLGSSTTILGWRCTAAGTPGTWVQLNLGGTGVQAPLMSVGLLFDGTINDSQRLWGAPATNDWVAQIGELPAPFNSWKCPSNANLANLLTLDISFRHIAPTVPNANGLQFQVMRASDQAILLNTFVSTTAEQYNIQESIALTPGDLTAPDAIALAMTCVAGTGPTQMQMTCLMSLDVV